MGFGIRGLKLTGAYSLTSLFFVSRIFGYDYPIVYVGWTLEYEMLFYALFAAGLFFKDERIAFTFPIAPLICLTAFGLVSPIVLEFVFGMICAKLYLMGVGRSISPTAFIVGALWLVLTVWFRFEIDRTWLWGIPAFLVVFGVVGISQANNRLLIYLYYWLLSVAVVVLFVLIPSTFI